MMQLEKEGLYKNHGIVKNNITIGIISGNNINNTKNVFLRLHNPHINKIEVYNGDNRILTGDIYGFKNRPVIFNDFIIPLSKLLKGNDTVYITLDKINENLSYSLELIQEKELDQLRTEQIFLLGGALTLTCILVIYFIILGIISKKVYNFLFASYIIATCVWFLNNGGFLYQYWWPENPVFHNISRTLFSTLTITAFALFILDYYKEHKNVFYRIIQYVIYFFMPIRISALLVKNNYEDENQLKYVFLIINAIVLSVLFITLIIFIISKAKDKSRWLHSAGFLLYAISLFLEVSHQYKFDPLPIYHQSVFFPYVFLTGQILLIGCGNLLTLLKTNRLIAQRNFQELIEIDNDLAKNIISVQEYERTLIGEELHDKVGAELFISKIKTETITKKYPGFEGNTELIEVGNLLNNIIKEIRFIISSIMPLQLENNHSNKLFEKLVEQFRSVASFSIELTYGINVNLPANINIQLCRILSELLTNTLKHSSCSIVYINFNLNNNQLLEVTYIENTKGFEYIEDPSHFGIKNIMHRVSYLKGSIEKDISNLSMKYIIKIPMHEQ